MATFGFGLRAKSMLALALACLLALLPASLIGWQVLDGVRNHFGEAYARSLTLLKRQQIIAPVLRDLALSRRFANSEVTRQWLQDESNPALKALFFKEAEGYREDLGSRSYFLASDGSKGFYFNDKEKAFSDAPRYTLSAEKESDSWFFGSLRQTEPYNINVNYDAHLQITQVWLNMQIRNGDKVLGVAGTGIDLSAFLKDFIDTDEPGITPMIVARTGAIQAHRNKALIAENQAASQATAAQTLAGLLPDAAARDALAAAMVRAEQHTDAVETLHASLDGRPQLLALAYIPELKWHVVSAVDLKAVRVLDDRWLYAAFAAIVLLIGLLLLAFAYAVDRLVLNPLKELQRSASQMAQGNFDVSLPLTGRDELGDLSEAFGIMARQVRRNTEELETLVQARTQALEAANQDMRRAHKQINDSIDYASLIQKAILPNQQLAQQLGPHHFVLWRPRDVVGGDFYIFRSEGERHILGVVDCAGHGVPGALMTMLARAALDQAMTQSGIASPAEILTQTDASMRHMLSDCELPRAIATNMDIGLAFVVPDERRLRYAGAKISLYWSDGNEIGEIKGTRRAIGDRRFGRYEDQDVEMRPGVTYYLATDGFLDQAGGDLGFGFGNTRFAQLLLAHARLPMAEQASALDAALTGYRGGLPQRDDVTILSFRFD
ncbi:biofilm regulation protein phosphatase SiaA [Propionivibrio dicarboxylicus]|uniref:Serine phosphatase RsbU, regulator of sigma subunit n=1 Tax=Propionivibrio dicarboxylicus TaxID=83767 RepID=A0A1G8GR40_9RHOO|nr:biofilm regulation protein phosphatase SiaA [Propionivibrio dicarboxylicus]SDH96898.1 Serine phosphatase RsbU, regulator of sigma subunit [Propionivibrio dicarboxylicus]